MKLFTYRAALLASVIAELAVLSVGTAHAQDVQPAAGSEAPPQVEEIVVTAQKRSENAQKVPIAITAISGETTERYGLADSQSLASAVPGLTFTRQNANASIYLRGVGLLSGGPGLEGPVAVYVDGVYQISLSAQIFDFNNLDRVEVLKGPQGTLFGRNATGGVLNIFTKAPPKRASAAIELGYGDHETFGLKGYLGGPLSDTLSMDISGVSSQSGKGFGTNLTTGNDARRNYYSNNIRSKMLWRPSDNLDIELAGGYTNSKTSFSNYSLAPGQKSQPLFGTPSVLSAGWFDQYGMDGVETLQSAFGSVKAAYDLGWATLSNQTAYQWVTTKFNVDADAVPASLIEPVSDAWQKATTNELQLVSAGGGRFNWVTGLFYMDLKVHNVQDFNGLVYAGAGNIHLVDSIPTTSIAPYAQATWSVLDNTRLTAGIRYTRDKFSIEAVQTARTGVNAGRQTLAVDMDSTQSKVTYRLAIDHDLTDNVLVYASYNTGFHSGTFNIQVPSTPVLRPETLETYEAGIKTKFLDGRARLNAAFFYYNEDNLVFRNTQNGISILRNVASSKMKGFDLDGQFAISNTAAVTFGLAFLDAHYTDFPGAPIYQDANTNELTPGEPNGPRTVNLNGNAAGNTMIQSPRWQYQIGLQKTFETSSGDISFGGNYSYRTKTFFAPDNLYAQPGYGLLSGTLSWNVNNGPYTVKIWGRNLTNQRFVQGYNEGGFNDVIIPGAPRTYGIVVQAKW